MCTVMYKSLNIHSSLQQYFQTRPTIKSTTVTKKPIKEKGRKTLTFAQSISPDKYSSKPTESSKRTPIGQRISSLHSSLETQAHELFPFSQRTSAKPQHSSSLTTKIIGKVQQLMLNTDVKEFNINDGQFNAGSEKFNREDSGSSPVENYVQVSENQEPNQKSNWHYFYQTR